MDVKKPSFCIVLSCVWVLLTLLASPWGEFPMIDDWAFAHPLHSLFTQGKFDFMDWQDMTLVAQLAWGWLFCLPFGFSYNALKLSTLVLGLIGVLASYTLLREAGVSRKRSFLAALLVAANPLYLLLSNTFMTDVPCAALSVVSFLYFARVLRSGGRRNLLLAIGFSCLAVLIRQIAAVVPIAFVIAYAARYGIRRNTAGTILYPFAALFALVAIYQYWVHPVFGMPPFFSPKMGQAAAFMQRPFPLIVDKAYLVGLKIFVYLGVFLFPLLSQVFLHQLKALTGARRVYFLVLILGVFVLLFQGIVPRHIMVPEQGNLLRHYGFDAVSIFGTSQLVSVTAAPRLLLVAIALLGCAGGAILFAGLFHAAYRFIFRRRKQQGDCGQEWTAFFAFLTALIYCAPLVGVHFWDRYLIFLLPFPALLLSKGDDRAKEEAPRGKGISVAFVCAAVLCLITAGLTRDYFSWNKARWKALRYLTREQGIAPRAIDGGFEFNGAYNYNPRFKECERDPVFWMMDDPEYLVSFGSKRGFEQVKAYPYLRVFPPRKDSIFILRRLHQRPDPSS